MQFELLTLYRNYRNIENMCIDKEHSMVLGHFDRVSFASKTSTADKALDNLYDSLLSEGKRICADVQPMILFSYDDYAKNDSAGKFKAVSFLQIKKTNSSQNIHDFFCWAKSSINKVIVNLQKEKSIGNVTANLYIPFSFMNTAVIFYADNLTDICTVVKNIIHSRLADFQYSVLSLPDDKNLLHNIDAKINISLRFIWKEKVDANEAIEILNKAIEEYKPATINHLLGNNDCLLHVPNSGYKIISMILEPSGQFAEFMSKVENTRATISFPEDSINILKNPLDFGIDDLCINISDALIHKGEKRLFESLTSLKNRSPKILKRDVNDVFYRVVEFSKFMDIIKKHAVKGIATPLYLSMKKPYEMFLEMAADRVCIVDSESTNSILETIGNVMNEMLSYFGNIFHCNLGFFEERGFYNNIIGLASNVELAYNQYANRICNAIISEEERTVDGLDIRCSVTSDNEPLICTSDIFENTPQPQGEEKSLVKVNIPVSYVFKYDLVSKIIIHEVAHHVGGRDRKNRLKAICKCICSVIADGIIQISIFAPSNKLSDYDKKILEDFENTSSYNKIHDKLCADIFETINNNITETVIKTCEPPYFMDDVIDSLYYSLNSFPENEVLVNTLSEIIAKFQRAYYDELDEFYISYEKLEEEGTDLFRELSGLSIESYNKQIVKKKIMNSIGHIIGAAPAPNVDEIEEKNCYYYLSEIGSLIIYFCNAVSEAYCDLMMIRLFNMSFQDYLDVMYEYDKTIENIIDENDYLTWIRINIIAKFLNSEIETKKAIPKTFAYFNDLGLYDFMNNYFNSIQSEFDNAYKRSRDDSVLKNFIENVTKKSEEKQVSAIYDMYYSIGSNEEVC